MQLSIDNSKDYDFLKKENEFDSFGGNGDNISPALFWENAPDETKSFAITLFDPDAPTGSGFWHWVAYDIPSTTKALPANSGQKDTLSIGTIKQAISDFGTRGYGGCCPPEGDIPHRYIFTLHALDCETLDVSQDTPNSIIRFMIQMHSIQQASIVQLYKR